MAFQPATNCAEIRLGGVLDNVRCMTTWYVRRNAAIGQSNLDNIVNDFITELAVPLTALLSEDYTHEYVAARGLTVENDVQRLILGGIGSGGIASQSLPANVAFSIGRYSGFTGRSARGRVYIPAIPSSYIDTSSAGTNSLTSTAANALKNAVDDWRSYVAGLASWTPVIISRYANGAAREEAVTYEWIATQWWTLKVSTQRGRLR